MPAQVWGLTIQLSILFLQVVLTIVIFRYTRKQNSTYACDRLYLEITKKMLSDPKLWEFYNVGPAQEKKRWQQLGEDEKRMYVFCEMNYFHFAFVHREYLQKRVDEAYRNIYKVWLKKLIQYSPLFLQVHLDSKEHFEPAFAQLVDALQKEVART